MYEDLTLDDLVIRSSSHTPFFGIYLATHAIRDALCMCHASVGCKVKTQLHLVDHDGIADAHNRRRYSQFIDEDLIQGSTAQLESEIVSFQKRLQSQLVVIDCSTPISLQGQSLKAVVERLRATTGVDVVHVDSRNAEQDYLSGYAATVATLFRRQFEKANGGERASPVQTHADEVTVLGYPFDRYEPDHTGNIAELRRLLFGLGLKAKAVFFAGEPYATLQDAVHARHHVLLPYAHGMQADLVKLGLQGIATGLPMSVGGTRRWLTQVATATGIAPARLDKLLDHELDRVKPLAELARKHLRGRTFAAFADPPRLAGLVATLSEVEMVPTVLGTLHFSLGGRETVQRLLRDHHGIELPTTVQWLHDPAPHELVRLASHVRHDGPTLQGTDLVIGTSIERQHLQASARPFVEFGFPSERRHHLFPAPWLGFHGAMRLTEQVLHALEWPPPAPR